jgi:RHH-type proline utilization regulon transcriptional repressor/proline dehydrogenase/delta 1-pyrroline-5-carboxylate dehydrogenase
MTTVQSGTVTPHDAAPDLADQAVALAQRWVAESADAPVNPPRSDLAGVLKDPNGLPFTIGFVDGVMRPESLAAAASNLQRVAPLVPDFLPWYLRAAVRTGGAVAPVLPAPSCRSPAACSARWSGTSSSTPDPTSSAPLATIRESGARLNLNLLGEAVLGEKEARAPPRRHPRPHPAATSTTSRSRSRRSRATSRCGPSTRRSMPSSSACSRCT